MPSLSWQHEEPNAELQRKDSSFFSPEAMVREHLASSCELLTPFTASRSQDSWEKELAVGLEKDCSKVRVLTLLSVVVVKH